MDETILSLKTKLWEKEREIAALKKKLDQSEKVCNRYSINSLQILWVICVKNWYFFVVSLALWYLPIFNKVFDSSIYYLLLYGVRTV